MNGKRAKIIRKKLVAILSKNGQLPTNFTKFYKIAKSIWTRTKGKTQ